MDIDRIFPISGQGDRVFPVPLRICEGAAQQFALREDFQLVKRLACAGQFHCGRAGDGIAGAGIRIDRQDNGKHRRGGIHHQGAIECLDVTRQILGGEAEDMAAISHGGQLQRPGSTAIGSATDQNSALVIEDTHRSTRLGGTGVGGIGAGSDLVSSVGPRIGRHCLEADHRGQRVKLDRVGGCLRRTITSGINRADTGLVTGIAERQIIITNLPGPKAIGDGSTGGTGQDHLDGAVGLGQAAQDNAPISCDAVGGTDTGVANQDQPCRAGWCGGVDHYDPGIRKLRDVGGDIAGPCGERLVACLEAGHRHEGIASIVSNGRSHNSPIEKSLNLATRFRCDQERESG